MPSAITTTGSLSVRAVSSLSRFGPTVSDAGTAITDSTCTARTYKSVPDRRDRRAHDRDQQRPVHHAQVRLNPSRRCSRAAIALTAMGSAP